MDEVDGAATPSGLLSVVSTAWRLRRALGIEAALFDREETPASAFIGYAAKKMVILSRYESTLERGLFKALHELQRLQAARQGEAVPVPEAVDIEVSVSEPDGLALHGRTMEVRAANIHGGSEHQPSQ